MSQQVDGVVDHGQGEVPSNTLPVEQHAAGRVSWSVLVLLGIVVLVVVRFLLVYVVRYWSFDPQVFGDSFWPRRYGLMMHLVGGSIAILAGPVQLLLGETRFAPAWHRALGKVYLGGVVVGCLGAYYLSLTSPDFGWVFASGLFGLAVAWTITTGMAYLAIKRRLVQLHREWMIRSYIVTLGFVFFRLFQEVAPRLGVSDPNESAKAGAWLCWAVPLLIAEPILQIRRFQRPVQGAVRGVARGSV